MEVVGSIASPTKLTREELIATVRDIVIAGGDAEEVARVLQINERRARALYLMAETSITVSDFSWAPEEQRAFCRAAKLKMAVTGVDSKDPKIRKIALDAIQSIEEELRNVGKPRLTDLPTDPRPATFTIDVNTVIDSKPQ